MAIDWDLLDEDCAGIADWVDGDTGTAVSEVDPAGQFRFDTNAGAAGDAYAYRYRDEGSPPDRFTMEIKTYFDDIGLVAASDHCSFQYHTATWMMGVNFASDGLFVYKTGGATTEVGTNIVLEGGVAAWQTWKFEVDKSGGEASATVEVYLDNISQGIFDCDFETGGNDGRVDIVLYGKGTDNMVSHFDYIRIGTGIERSINVSECIDMEDKVVGG